VKAARATRGPIPRIHGQIAEPPRENSASARPSLVLGYPFDQLFDRECGLEYWKDKGIVPAIKLPIGASPGTGNIVITGPPGSGKSTLALQWAVCCARRQENCSNAAYISLETTADELITKAEPFGWHRWVREALLPRPAREFETQNALASDLADLLLLTTKTVSTSGAPRPKGYDQAPDRGDPTRRVLLFSLSPRPLVSKADDQELFWRRYQQLEKLLSAADRLTQLSNSPPRDGTSWNWERLNDWNKIGERKKAFRAQRCQENPSYLDPGMTMLPLVVIDSLNMFGGRALGREEMFRLFGLFRKYQRIGVFVVESTQETAFDSTMADVVVSLTNQKDRGYLVQHIEIEKSRYFNHVNGLHPYKPLSPPLQSPQVLVPPIPGKETEPSSARRGIVVYPSLHYIVLRTEQAPQALHQLDPAPDEPDCFGVNALKSILPIRRRGGVVLIEGPRGTFKTTFALNFLAAGLRIGESGLLIRLRDIPLLRRDAGKPSMLDRPLSNDLANATPPFRWSDWSLSDESDATKGNWSGLAPKHKTTISVWRHEQGGDTVLYEIDFKGGALMPEEFVQVIRDVLMRRPDLRKIRRVVLHDISAIGVSYPFLRQSITTGDIFLSAFVHIMRNACVDLVMTGTTSGLAVADDMVSRARSLADAVLSCQFCDVFGDRHVIVRGLGPAAGGLETEQSGDSVPPVVRMVPGRNRIFEVDTGYLDGLVGFDTGRIQRPGLAIHLYEERGGIHGEYNRQIHLMLKSGLASWLPYVAADPTRNELIGDVKVLPFRPKDSEAIHDSLTIMGQGSPLDKTVLFTVDEFCMPPRREDGRSSATSKLWGQIKEGNVLKWGELIYAEDQPERNEPGLWPYYANVLFLAYRKDLAEDNTRRLRSIPLLKTLRNPSSFPSWRDVQALAELIFVEPTKPRNPPAHAPDPISPGSGGGGPHDSLPRVNRAFWFDHLARETLSCMLLDALLAAHARYKQKQPDKLSNVLTEPKPKHRRLLRKELAALCNLFSRTEERNLGRDSQERDLLRDDAGVYVCWYSQLRVLIERKPALATALDICPLPGGGFRGDWFIGILQGSVSQSLGRTVVEKLCRREEDYKRFAQGVGLPVQSQAYKEGQFYAWPRSEHVKLKDSVYSILKRAWWRHDIEEYLKIRSTLYTIARQLTPLAGPVPTDDDVVYRIVDRLFEQIRLLAPEQLD
jgi:hypothetical protein